VRADRGSRARRGTVRVDLTLAFLFLCTACSADTLSLGEGRQLVRDSGVGSTRDGGLGDSAVDASGSVEFAAPTEVVGVSVTDSKDDDPSLTRDLTVLFFDSRRAGGSGKEDIWRSTRSSASTAWETPTPVSELNTSVRETGLALSSDGLRIWFSSDREGGAGGLDVYVAARSERSGVFSSPTRVPELSTAGDDLISAVDDALRTVWLARRSDDDDDYDLFVARRDSPDAAWSSASALEELNSDKEESDAFAVRGGLQLIFTRGGDLYLAERGLDGRYGAAQPLTSVNSEHDDRDAWASDDLRTLVFSSNRSGAYLLYQADR
jgi:hypothetical protein